MSMINLHSADGAAVAYCSNLWAGTYRVEYRCDTHYLQVTVTHWLWEFW